MGHSMSPAVRRQQRVHKLRDVTTVETKCQLDTMCEPKKSSSKSTQAHWYANDIEYRPNETGESTP